MAKYRCVIYSDLPGDRRGKSVSVIDAPDINGARRYVLGLFRFPDSYVDEVEIISQSGRSLGSVASMDLRSKSGRSRKTPYWVPVRPKNYANAEYRINADGTLGQKIFSADAEVELPNPYAQFEHEDMNLSRPWW